MSHGVDPGIHRIVLVGFMASGKSTVGRRLARRLVWEFVDFDDAIRERVGRSPGEVIRTDGETVFRDLEADLTRTLAGASRMVLAPGGGWLTRPGLLHELGSGTLRVWLRVSLGEALRRAAADDADRPLLGPTEGREERAAALLRTREPLYARAELEVDVDGKDPDVVVDEILARLARPGGR